MFDKLKKKAFVQHVILELPDREVPAKIYREHRQNVRASIGKTAAILRMPILIPQNEEAKHIQWFKDWVNQQFQNQYKLENRFKKSDYKTGDMLLVMGQQFLLNITYSDKKSHSATIKGEIIYLKLSHNDSPIHLQKSIKHLISRILAQTFLPQISERVHQLNNTFFQKKIKSVNLKYNQSNWGSCSTKGNINLSTRLLLAPGDVRDYVIIHELAHLVEMNHSKRFWAQVAKADPDYKKKEKWLTDFGYQCDF